MKIAPIGVHSVVTDYQSISVRHFTPFCQLPTNLDALSDTKLGIVVSPTDVRLITGPDDPYKWSRLPVYENLFQKHLSKHSTGAYIKIYYGVGKFFEAVPADLEVELSYNSMGQEVYPLPTSGSDGGELQQVRRREYIIFKCFLKSFRLVTK